MVLDIEAVNDSQFCLQAELWGNRNIVDFTCSSCYLRVPQYTVKQWGKHTTVSESYPIYPVRYGGRSTREQPYGKLTGYCPCMRPLHQIRNVQGSALGPQSTPGPHCRVQSVLLSLCCFVHTSLQKD